MNTLILPVCGMWGPTHRSTIGPHLYTVVDVPSGIFVSIRYFLYLLYCRPNRVQQRPTRSLDNDNKEEEDEDEDEEGRTANISSRVSFGTTSRSNFCFSLIALSATFSSDG